jgi:hypothetical protein
MPDKEIKVLRPGPASKKWPAAAAGSQASAAAAAATKKERLVASEAPTFP